jgi:hypothetical protein
VRTEGESSVTFNHVVVRIKDKLKLEMHVDTDEANAAGLTAANALVIWSRSKNRWQILIQPWSQKSSGVITELNHSTGAAAGTTGVTNGLFATVDQAFAAAEKAQRSGMRCRVPIKRKSSLPCARPCMIMRKNLPAGRNKKPAWDGSKTRSPNTTMPLTPHRDWKTSRCVPGAVTRVWWWKNTPLWRHRGDHPVDPSDSGALEQLDHHDRAGQCCHFQCSSSGQKCFRLCDGNL